MASFFRPFWRPFGLPAADRFELVRPWRSAIANSFVCREQEAHPRSGLVIDHGCAPRKCARELSALAGGVFHLSGLRSGGRYLVECQACPRQDGVPPGEFLPATDCDIDVKRIELHAIGYSTDQFSRDDRGAGAHERVQDDVAAAGAIPHRIGNQCHRLDGRVQLELIEPAGAEAVDARISPTRLNE